MKIQYFITCGMLAPLLLIDGCASIDDPLSPGKAIWELRGSISNPDESLKPTKIRAVLIWDFMAPYSSNARENLGEIDKEPHFVQDVRINPEFPANFTIKMDELPPEDILRDNTYCTNDNKCVSCKTANAKLIIYEDKNANNKLDFLPFAADETVDRVIGPSESYDIVYLESDKECDVSDFWSDIGDDIKFQPGFNVIQFTSSYRPGTTVLDPPQPTLGRDDWICVGEPPSADESPVCDVTVDGQVRLLSEDEALELTLKDDLYHQFLVCLDHCDIIVKDGVTGSSCQARGRPSEDFDYVGWVPIDEIAADSEFFCYDNGYTLAFKTFIETRYESGGKICGYRTEKYIYGRSSVTEDQPTPKAWPCEIKE